MRTEPPPDELYFVWLYGQVASVTLKARSRTYWSLFRQLYQTEFVWTVPNDDNRVEDGRDLRRIFIEDERLDEPNPQWMHLGCSMLEMLIGLSRRLGFEMEIETRDAFWLILSNAELDDLNDARYDSQTEQFVANRLHDIIWRHYSPNGYGGLFPLRNPDKDQTRVEIWYQLNAYLLEND